MDGSGKKCSIVFIGAESPSQVNSYLRCLPAERLSVDYELLFVNAHQPQIEFAYSNSTKASIKFVESERGLGFEQLCIEATRQASGEYILFVNSPISYEQVVAAIRQLEISGVDIEAPQEKKYIIVKATAFIQARNFRRLSQQQQEQNYNQTINQLMHLIAGSATYIEDVFFIANKNRLLFENGIKYIDLTKTDDCNVYKLLFLRSIKGYLDSGLEFNNVDQCNDFYQNVTLPALPCLLSQTAKGIAQAHVREVPWFVGIVLSVPHLKYSSSSVRHTPADWQQSAVILVSVYNETRFTELCFKAVRKFTNFPYHLIAVNNSTIDMQHFKRSMLRKGLIDEWFNTGCTSHADGLQKSLARVGTFRYIATLDSDAIVIKKGWLTEFVDRLNRENAALIGPQTSSGNNLSIKGYAIHPCCMVIDRERIGSKFEINFAGKWPFDTGHLLTWDCLVYGIQIVKISHKIDGNYATGSSLINKSVRHYWYTSRILDLEDDALIDGCKVETIREKLDMAYSSTKLSQIREYHMPEKSPP
jgi:biotin operon repressor